MLHHVSLLVASVLTMRLYDVRSVYVALCVFFPNTTMYQSFLSVFTEFYILQKGGNISHLTIIIPYPLLSLNGYSHSSSTHLSSGVQLICMNQCSKTHVSILRYKNRCAVVVDERKAYLHRDPIGSGFLLHDDILFQMAVDPSPWWFPSLHLGTPMPPTGRLSWAAGI